LTFVRSETTIDPIVILVSALTTLKNIQLNVVIEVIELIEASIMEKKLSFKIYIYIYIYKITRT